MGTLSYIRCFRKKPINERQIGAVATVRMLNFGVRFFFLAAMIVGIMLVSTINAAEQAGPAPVSPEVTAREKDGCTKNLKALYAAIEAYRKDHKDIPNWFSDLVPDYLPDVNVLTCPVARRTGRT